jgi:hypothetical protein
MIQPPFRAALMTLIGAPSLLASRSSAAYIAAIAVPTVAVRAKEEGCQAVRAKTSPLQQYGFLRRHASSRRAGHRHPFRVSLDLSVWPHLLTGVTTSGPHR